MSPCAFPQGSHAGAELELFVKKRKGVMNDSQAVVPSPKQGPGSSVTDVHNTLVLKHSGHDCSLECVL